MMIDIIPIVDPQMPKGSSLRFTIHDELVAVAHKDVAREAAICMKENMQRKWEKITEDSNRPEIIKKYYPGGWWCPADVHVGTNWKEAKKGNKELEVYLGIK